MNKWTWLVLGVFAIWGLISWNWYVCGVKGFCNQDTSIQEVADESISIGEIDQEVAERPTDAISGGSVVTEPVRETQTVTRESIVECDAYLQTFIRRGFNNSSSDVNRLEQYLNTYEDEDLVVNGVFEVVDEQAVMRFQEKYREEVLTPWGLTEPTGYVFRTTRDHINRLYCAFASVENN